MAVTFYVCINGERVQGFYSREQANAMVREAVSNLPEGWAETYSVEEEEYRAVGEPVKEITDSAAS